MIPFDFTSMVHDSYKNFLRDSWFTKTFDDLFNKWISQRLLCLVLRCFFGVQTSVFIQDYIDFCFSVSSFVLSKYGVFLSLNIKHQRHWRNKRTISLEARIIIMGGSGGMFPRKKKLKFGLAETPYPSIPGSNAINSYLFCCAFLRDSLFMIPQPNWQRFMIPQF